MSDTEPILAIWAEYDPSVPGWAEAKKAIDAYQAGDIVTAIWRAQAVRDAWGQMWTQLSEALWALHPEGDAQARYAPPRREGKVRRGLRAVGEWIGAITAAMDFLEIAILVVVLVLASGVGLFQCLRNALP